MYGQMLAIVNDLENICRQMKLMKVDIQTDSSFGVLFSLSYQFGHKHILIWYYNKEIKKIYIGLIIVKLFK